MNQRHPHSPHRGTAVGTVSAGGRDSRHTSFEKGTRATRHGAAVKLSLRNNRLLFIIFFFACESSLLRTNHSTLLSLQGGMLHTAAEGGVDSSNSKIVGGLKAMSPAPLASGPVRGLALFVPITRFSAKEHRARVDGRATARHLHGMIERAVRCYTVKVSAESAGAVASNVFLESLTTRQSGRLAQPDGGAGTPAGRGCHLQGRSSPPSWTTL